MSLKMSLTLSIDDIQVDQNDYVSMITTVNGNQESLGWGRTDMINAIESLESSFSHEALLLMLVCLAYKADPTLATIGDLVGATITLNMTSGTNVVEVAT